MRGKIPIREGKRLCDMYAAPVVIVFSLHDGGDTFNVMTYGQTMKLCKHAADLGRKFADAVLNGTVAPAAVEPTDIPEVPAQWDGMKRGKI